MVPFQPINLKYIIHYDTIAAFDFNIHNLTTRFKVSEKDPPNIIHGHMSFIHSRLRRFSLLSQDISYSLSYMHQVRDTSQPRQDTTYFTLTHFTCHYLSHLGITIIIFLSSYKLPYHRRYNHHILIQSSRNNHASTLRLHTQEYSRSLHNFLTYIERRHNFTLLHIHVDMLILPISQLHKSSSYFKQCRQVHDHHIS